MTDAAVWSVCALLWLFVRWGEAGKNSPLSLAPLSGLTRVRGVSLHSALLLYCRREEDARRRGKGTEK